MSTPDVKQIVEQYLREHGFDGLFCSHCSCGLGDLFPCAGGGVEMCEAGYKAACDCGGERDFHIVPDKPATD